MRSSKHHLKITGKSVETESNSLATGVLSVSVHIAPHAKICFIWFLIYSQIPRERLAEIASAMIN